MIEAKNAKMRKRCEISQKHLFAKMQIVVFLFHSFHSSHGSYLLKSGRIVHNGFQ